MRVFAANQFTTSPTRQRSPRTLPQQRRPMRSITSLSTGALLLQRQCACGGGCPRCQDKFKLQTKLKMSEPGDKYEQEADRVADAVMRMPMPSSQPQMTLQADQGLGVQRTIQSPTPPTQSVTPPAIAPSLSQSLGSSQPLAPATRAFFEPRFNHDFSQVRIHTDGRAAESAQALQANAYTLGHHIVFNAAQYAPGTARGQRLLAHELTHVIQQTQRKQVQRCIQRQQACEESDYETSPQHEIIQRWYQVKFPDHQLLREYIIPQAPGSSLSRYLDLVSVAKNEIYEIMHPSDNIENKRVQVNSYLNLANTICEPKQWKLGKSLPTEVIPDPRAPLFTVSPQEEGILKYEYPPGSRSSDRDSRYPKAIKYLKEQQGHGTAPMEEGCSNPLPEHIKLAIDEETKKAKITVDSHFCFYELESGITKNEFDADAELKQLEEDKDCMPSGVGENGKFPSIRCNREK